MISGILGRKVGMTQIFKEGKCVPVTVIEAGPCTVLQVKTQENDGYCSIQLGYLDKRKKSSTKAEMGHAQKHAQTEPKKFIREIPWDGKEEVKAGQKITIEVLKKMKFVDVTGTTKGRGFQGCVKRHGFGGGPKTHGQSDRQRAPGSIGCSAIPSRVFKGQRMCGHMGNVKCTMQNLEIIDIDEERNYVAVKGAIAGYNGSYVIIKKALKKN